MHRKSVILRGMSKTNAEGILLYLQNIQLYETDFKWRSQVSRIVCLSVPSWGFMTKPCQETT